MTTELLALGAPGGSLRVVISPIGAGRPLAADEEPSFDAVYEIDANPFGGTLRDALLASDLTAWRDAIAELRPPADITLGGGRAAELHLHVEAGRDDHWTVEVQLRRSGDDPWPEIRYLVFGVEPFADRAVKAATTALGGHS